MGVISLDELEAQLSDVDVPLLKGRGESNGVAATASPKEIFRNYRDVIPRGAVARLASKKATGDRSKVLWKLSNNLLESGLSPGEVVVLLEGSVWNKFGPDRSRLWADVNKAASSRPSQNGNGQPRHKASKSKRRDPAQKPWSIPLDRYLAVETKDPQWMIEGLWSDRSHGIIAGEPKTRKSYLALDIALSVATGTDCLGTFPVKKKGPVLLVQEEVSDAEMRKRLRYIASSKDLGGTVEHSGETISVHLPDPVGLYLRNRQQFDLSNVESLEALTREVDRLGIRLIILDPLQMMLGELDLNKDSQMRPVLQNLLRLKEATGCGIMIVHHYAKSSIANPRSGGQRMSGSHVLHAWCESALYLSKPEPLVTHIEREFRNFEPVPDFDIEFAGGNEAYDVIVSMTEPKAKKRPAKTKLDLYVEKHDGVSVLALSKHLGIDRRTLEKYARRSNYIRLEMAEPEGKGGRPRLVLQYVKNPRK